MRWVGWLAGWLAGLMAGGQAGWLACWQAGRQAGSSVLYTSLPPSSLPYAPSKQFAWHSLFVQVGSWTQRVTTFTRTSGLSEPAPTKHAGG